MNVQDPLRSADQTDRQTEEARRHEVLLHLPKAYRLTMDISLRAEATLTYRDRLPPKNVCIFHPQILGITLWIEMFRSSQTLPLEPNAYFLGTRDAQRCQAKLLSFRRNFTSAKSVFVCHRHNTPSITYALAE